MKNCISIFITDYDMLNKLVSMDCEEQNLKETKKTKETSSNETNEQDIFDTSDFLSKFFNYRLELRDESHNAIFNYYNKFFKESDPAFSDIYQYLTMSPGTWCKEVAQKMSKKIEETKNDKNRYYGKQEDRDAWNKKITEYEQRLDLFNSLIKNPRNVVKFCNIFRNNFVICNKIMSPITEETKTYIDSRNIGQVLCVLAFAEIFLPFEYGQLIERGANYADPPIYGKNEVVTLQRSLLIEITQGMVYEEYSNYKKLNLYIKTEIQKFIETFLSKKRKISELIKPFSTQDQEWIAAINDNNISVIRDHWIEMVEMVLEKDPYIHSKIDNTWRVDKFGKLLDFANQQIQKDEWKIDTLFSMFDANNKPERLFAAGTKMLATFWEHLQKFNISQKPSENLTKGLERFPYHYTYDRTRYIYNLAHYLIPYDGGKNDPKDLRDYMLNSNRTYSENMSIFLAKLAESIPNFSLHEGTWVEQYKEISGFITDYLKRKGMNEFSDIKHEIELMDDFLEEILSFEKIVQWVKNGNENIWSSSFDENNIEDTIQYFARILATPFKNRFQEIEFEQKFDNFFRWLANTKKLVINKQQISRLQQLITDYIDQTKYSGLFYRRVLLNLLNNQSEAVANSEQSEAVATNEQGEAVTNNDQ